MLPAFRADKIMNIEAERYPEFLAKLEACSLPIAGLNDLERALEARLADFIKAGAVAADIALEKALPVGDRSCGRKGFCQEAERAGAHPGRGTEAFKGYLTYFLCKMYAKNHIVTEIHIGAMRNNNAVMLNKLGLGQRLRQRFGYRLHNPSFQAVRQAYIRKIRCLKSSCST